eukprot:598345-Pyramimonas_sp.AAC.1
MGGRVTTCSYGVRPFGAAQPIRQHCRESQDMILLPSKGCSPRPALPDAICLVMLLRLARRLQSSSSPYACGLADPCGPRDVGTW